MEGPHRMASFTYKIMQLCDKMTACMGLHILARMHICGLSDNYMNM